MPPESIVQNLVERQVQSWFRRSSLEADPELDTHLETDGRWIALAGSLGTGASALARRLGERLGWRVLGDELVDAAARRLGVPSMRISRYDQRAVGAWEEFFEHLLHPTSPTREQYLRALRAVLRESVREGEAILVGHGYHWLLDPREGLRIRLVATLPERAARVARKRGVSVDEATRLLRNLESSEAAFASQAFHRSAEDATDYDLVLNASERDPQLLVEIIASLSAVRFGPLTPPTTAS